MDKQLQRVGMMLELSGLAGTNKQASEILGLLRKQAGVDKFAMMPTKWKDSKKSYHGTIPLDSLQGYFVQMWWGALKKLGLTTLECPPTSDIKVLSRALGASSLFGKLIKNPLPDSDPRKVLWASLREAWNKHSTDFETSWNRIFERAYNATNYIRGDKRIPDSETRTQLEMEQASAVFDRYFKGNKLYTFVQSLNLSNPESVFEQASALVVSNIANGNHSSKSVSTKPTDFEAPEGGEAYNFSAEDAFIPYGYTRDSGNTPLTDAQLQTNQQILEEAEKQEDWAELVRDMQKNDPDFYKDLMDIVSETVEIKRLSPEAVLSTKITTLAQMEILATLIDDCLSAESRDRIKRSALSSIKAGTYAILYAYLVMAGFTFSTREGESVTIKLSGNPFLVNYRSFQRDVAVPLRLADDFERVVSRLWGLIEKYIPKKLFKADLETFSIQMQKLVFGGVHPGVAFPEITLKDSRWFLVSCLKEFIRLRMILEISDEDVLEEFEPEMDGDLCIKALRAITIAPTQIVEEARLALISSIEKRR